MSKEIDFSKAPEGATHYSSYQDGDFAYWCKDIENDRYKWFYVIDREWKIGNAVDFLSSMRQITPQWSIYTNDKPLCELSDEQAAALFNAWRKGFEIENCLYDEKHEEFVWVNCFSVLSNIEGVYRIKSKSERELFIEKSKLIIGATTDDELVDAVIADLFDSGKFKLVEQQK